MKKTFILLKIFILLSISLALIACEQKPNTNIYHEVERTNDVYNINDGEYGEFCLRTVVIDSCEYLIGKNAITYQGYGYLSHKGNCKYCAERRKRELEDIK